MPHRTPRRQKIARLVHDHGFMSVEELARSLNVTPQTIRRDINVLCEHNILRRYHGGAAPGSSVQNEDYDTRKNKLQSEKAHIADLIAEHIPDNVSLFMSIGTTIEAVALALVKNHKNLCIITNNIHVASIVSGRPDYTVIITSGVVRPVDGGITGVATIDFINQFKVDYAILGASGIERSERDAGHDGQRPPLLPGRRPQQIRPQCLGAHRRRNRISRPVHRRAAQCRPVQKTGRRGRALASGGQRRGRIGRQAT